MNACGASWTLPSSPQTSPRTAGPRRTLSSSARCTLPKVHTRPVPLPPPPANPLVRQCAHARANARTRPARGVRRAVETTVLANQDGPHSRDDQHALRSQAWSGRWCLWLVSTTAFCRTRARWWTKKCTSLRAPAARMSFPPPPPPPKKKNTDRGGGRATRDDLPLCGTGGRIVGLCATCWAQAAPVRRAHACTAAALRDLCRDGLGLWYGSRVRGDCHASMDTHGALR